MITLDDTNQKFVTDALSHCIAILGLRMTDTRVCEANRERARQYRKIAVKARAIINGESEVNNG